LDALTDTVIAIAHGEPVAFTVMNSRSFTDFHVRYFFLMKNIQIMPVDEETNRTLFILCEGACPQAETIEKVSVLCHTELCPLNMPVINLSDWMYISTSQIGISAIYTYKR
jgi:hypothetical protein